jgi:hypothetical protein
MLHQPDGVTGLVEAGVGVVGELVAHWAGPSVRLDVPPNAWAFRVSLVVMSYVLKIIAVAPIVEELPQIAAKRKGWQLCAG